MFNFFKKVNNEFTNPDSDLLSGRFLKKITGAKVQNEENTTNLSVSAEKSPEISRLPEFEHKVVPTDEGTTTITNTIVSTNKDQIIVCYRCGRRGHKSPYCHAKTHIKGYDI